MAQQPLAERLRPQSLDDYIGQKHLVGENGVFRKFIATGSVPSFILWGPPGVGKTTLAKIVANALDRPFYTLSAVTSGVKDVREVIEKAKKAMIEAGVKPLVKPIRGGTDGSRLSFMGLPCPNLFTGGMNFHGRYEYASLTTMQKAMNTIINLARIWAE